MKLLLSVVVLISSTPFSGVLAQCSSSQKAAEAEKASYEAEQHAPTVYAAVNTTGSAEPGRDDIVETAVSAGKFNTLTAALKAAGLVGALRGEGPFTVFAPTDAAFAELPEGTVESLLKPENKDRLVQILTYHVAPGRLPAAEVVKRSGVNTLEGQRLRFETDNGVTVDHAKVTAPDIMASNGVIHVIDSVLLPSDKNIVETAAGAGRFSTLIAAAKAAGLAGALSGDGPLTVLAPTDDAFAKLPEGTVETLLKPENRDQLAAILKLHVVSGRVFAEDAERLGKASALSGDELIFSNRHGLKVNGAGITATDVQASNGVIHVIDAVLLPR